MALGIIAIVALSILGVFTKLMVSATKNTDLTTADALALTIMENAVTQGPPNWGVGGDFSITGGTASMYSGSSESTTKFVYQLKREEVTAHTSSMGKMFKLTVIVTWWEDEANEAASRAEYGRVGTELTRLVYVRGAP